MTIERNVLPVTNTQKQETVKDVYVQPIHPISETQLLTFKEVAAKLKVSERTIRRIVDEKSLTVIYIRNSPRIREIDLFDYINLQMDKCYNSKRMVLDVRTRGKRTCKNQRSKKVYTKGETRNFGGSVTSMNPAKELAALLEQ